MSNKKKFTKPEIEKVKVEELIDFIEDIEISNIEAYAPDESGGGY